MEEEPTTISFNKLPVLDISGNNVSEITGEFNADGLGDYLVGQWVGYVECHHCPRSETCKYVEPHPTYDWKKKEIICGVKADVIKNFIKLSFEILSKSDDEQKEKLLSSAYYLAEFAIDAETQVGILINDNWLDFLGPHAPNFFARIVHLRETLNKAAQVLGYIPELYDRKPILLVEGESEKAFLDKLREAHISWFSDLRVEVYGGSGNKHPKRIQMRLDKYIEDGYVCFMQGDKDGKEKDEFQRLIKQGVVNEENIFQFEFDFETAVPPKLLLKALKNMGHLEEVDKEEFASKLNKSKSSCKIMEEEYGLDVEPLKIELADELGWLMSDRKFHWFQDDRKFLEKTELGRFLEFVIKMH